MIPAVHPRGANVGGLLRYLFGPGRLEEHVNPRVVAAWDGAGPLGALRPPPRAGGWHDVRALTELLEQPVTAGFRPPAKPVWHASIRNHSSDRILTDAQWAHIAGEVIAAVGFAPHGDVDAVRWLAVRHNDDHIHVVATLVRQDRRTVWPWKDKRKAQTACRDLEERYGLYRVAPPGTGSRRWPSPAELNKATRLGAASSARPSRRVRRTARPAAPREVLRRRVREVAAIATGDADFFARLALAGVRVKLRRSSHAPQQVTGYAVGLDWHTAASGDIVFYGGGRLAPDLTLPQLRSRWTGTPASTAGGNAPRLAAMGNVLPHDVARRAAEMVRDAAEAMRAASSPGVASAIAYAAADLLTATVQAWEGRPGGPLSEAAEWFDRAAHDRHRVPGRRVSPARQLRAMARLVAAGGRVSRESLSALHLIFTLAALAERLAELRDAQGRLDQAQAARNAVQQLHKYEAPTGPRSEPRVWPARAPISDAVERRGRQR